ncbi:MAG: alpha/beta hydrolase [Steroidobacteraceae bacterium]|jgi:phospholipase/carboxylesterase|nr:alpha/beta hydrolase [Steroidobacteraceae bacterium]
MTMRSEAASAGEVITVQTGAGAPRAAVIWMHGLGADGRDFEPLVPQLRLPRELAVRFLFPQAPVRPVTINAHYRMRAWYDIYGFSGSVPEDAAGIAASTRRIHALVDREIAGGIDPSRIVLAGFSQGGAVALHSALRHPQRLGGLLALSTYLPLRERLVPEASVANRDLPILMCHGTFDPVLPLHFGEWSRDALRAAGFAVRWMTYPMHHEVSLPQVADIRAWLLERLR